LTNSKPRKGYVIMLRNVHRVFKTLKENGGVLQPLDVRPPNPRLLAEGGWNTTVGLPGLEIKKTLS